MKKNGRSGLAPVDTLTPCASPRARRLAPFYPFLFLKDIYFYYYLKQPKEPCLTLLIRFMKRHFRARQQHRNVNSCFSCPAPGRPCVLIFSPGKCITRLHSHQIVFNMLFSFLFFPWEKRKKSLTRNFLRPVAKYIEMSPVLLVFGQTDPTGPCKKR